MSDAAANQAPSSHPSSRLADKFLRVIVEDTTGLHPRLHLANVLMGLLPTGVAALERAAILRAAGFRVGEGSYFRGAPRINGPHGLYRNLLIGRDCSFDVGVTLDLEDQLTVGDCVTIGHEAMILTSSHEIGPKEHRAGIVVRAPVTIEDGAWLGPRCIILPGVTIGAGAVVSGGSLVNKDVPPHTRVAGTPAKVVEELGSGE